MKLVETPVTPSEQSETNIHIHNAKAKPSSTTCSVVRTSKIKLDPLSQLSTIAIIIAHVKTLESNYIGRKSGELIYQDETT